MPLVQSIELARAERVGAEGVAANDLAATLARTSEALDWLRARHADGSLPLLHLPAARDDLAAIGEAARRFTTGASDVVLLGTGGSSLGGQTLAQLAGYRVPGLARRTGLRLHFIDNLDPETVDTLLATVPLASTRFVAISKSGGTAETLMQAIAALAAVQQAGLATRVPELFLGVTEASAGNKPNGLRALFSAHKIAMLDHDPGIGGRYSVLSNVGLLPAAMLGLDIAAIRAGAASALAPVLDKGAPAEVPAALGAALAVSLAQTRRKSVGVMMAYADRLERFTRWYVQLWAESLGKDGKGTTPVAALGPVDQHSQLQLYMAGPRDKLVTLVTTATAGRGPHLDADLARLAGEPDFAGKSIGDLTAAEARATAETLANNGCPVRTLQLDRVDEAGLGELLMHCMLETIIAARLIGVDPFDQPAVEDGKVLAKRYLSGRG